MAVVFVRFLAGVSPAGFGCVVSLVKELLEGVASVEGWDCSVS